MANTTWFFASQPMAEHYLVEISPEVVVTILILLQVGFSLQEGLHQNAQLVLNLYYRREVAVVALALNSFT